MIKQNIFIINFNSLYEILEEIKENLTFEITKYENEETFITANHVDINNSLIIGKFNQELLLNENLSEKNFLNVKNFPLSLNKFIELINIQLIKLKYNYQSKVNIKGYDLNLNSKFLSKDDVFLKLTEKEIEIIIYLKKIN